MAYPFNEINLGNSKAPSMLESLATFGATTMPMGDGSTINQAAVPGLVGDPATLGGGAFGMPMVPGAGGLGSINPADAMAGLNNTAYGTPLTEVGAGSYGSVNPGFLSGDLYTKFMGGTAADGSKTAGILPVGLGAVQGLGSLFLGMQQYGLAKKQLEEGKRRYDQDYAAQKTLTNGRLEDRQRARVASSPTAYESVGNYMNKNGIK